MRVVLMLVLLAVLAAVGVYAYEGLAGPEMPGQGYAALAIGIAVSLLVGVGLMALLFYSSRRGYDEPPKYRSGEDLPR